MANALPTESLSVTAAPASRRGFFFGTAVAGVAAAAVSVMPQQPAVTAQLESLPPPPDKGGGYVDSAHVRRYYQTARV